jgi:hypothetical protein
MYLDQEPLCITRVLENETDFLPLCCNSELCTEFFHNVVHVNVSQVAWSSCQH